MREIKFRAWHTEAKAMLDQPYDGEYTSETVNLNRVIRGCQEDEHQVLMQYTGLHDKNGVEIFEGDILYSRIIKAPVEWIGHKWGVKGFYLASFDEPHDIFSEPNDFEVIGNIYENPELLETTNDI